jgi:hypothetical protein
MSEQLQGPFEKFVDSPYYSESELRGGAVMVNFSNKVSPRTFQTALVLMVTKCGLFLCVKNIYWK